MNKIAFPSIVIAALIVRLLVFVAIASRPPSPTEDASLYDDAGKEIATLLKAGQSPSDSQAYYEAAIGTQTYAMFTGVFYYLFGHSYALIIAFNSLLAGFGSFLFYQVIVSHYPNSSLTSRVMVFLDPSIILWSSIHGKDPIIFFALALALWSFYRILCNARGSLFLYFVSVAVIAAIRIHVALIVAAAAVLVLFLSRKTVRNPQARRLFWFSVCGVVILTALFTGTYVRQMPYEYVVGEVAKMLSGLATGGSALSIPEITGFSGLLAYLPQGMMAVLFRPFLWESGTLSFRAAAAYQVVLSLAVIVIAVRLCKRRLPADPLRSFMLIYVLCFVAVFALIVGNLGTLARMRLQLSPFIWCLLAATHAAASVHRRVVSRGTVLPSSLTS